MPITNDWKYLSREGPSTYNNVGPTFTVPDREVWHVLSVWVEYTASDTVATEDLCSGRTTTFVFSEEAAGGEAT